jgi:hypothetical protein
MVAPTDETIRNVTLEVLQQLGDNALVARVDDKVVRRLGVTAEEAVNLRRPTARTGTSSIRKSPGRRSWRRESPTGPPPERTRDYRGIACRASGTGGIG